MPESSLWGLIVGLILLALGLTYKNADIRHTLKRIREELSTARSGITSLNEKQQKQIQDIEMDHTARIDELSNSKSDLQATLSRAHTHLNSLEQSLIDSKAEFNARLLLLKEQYEKEIEELTKQNKEHVSTIDQLSGAADAFRDEMRQMRTIATETQKELTKLKADHATLQQLNAESERLCNERKFLLEVAEKKIAELSKPIEAASASSAPGPDDYHATRRSFFHTDNDRPKRR